MKRHYFISPGAPIAVVAPSGSYTPERLAAGVKLAKRRGVNLQPMHGLDATHRYLAGNDAHRANQLIRALTDPAWSAVWIARGGYGITRILHRIPWEKLPPRLVIGFSDVTPLLTALHRIGSPVIHGPVVHSLGLVDDASLNHLFNLITGRRIAPLKGQTWIRGKTEGWLCGGNLSMFAATCGTPWQLKARGSILVLEDVGEAPYRVDRMLQQLRSAGVLEGVRGIAFGEFRGCEPPKKSGWTLKDVLLDHVGDLGIPVIGQLPIGHGEANRAFPWGVKARIHEGKLSWETPSTIR